MNPLFSFMPHGHCFMWNKELLAVTVFSDIVTGLAYFVLPLMLYQIRKKRPDFPFLYLFKRFAIFILACGSTHFVMAWNMWHANYWIEAVLKSSTALVSITAAVLLKQAIPAISSIPSPEQLQSEIERRQQAEKELRQVLQQRTRERDQGRVLTEDIVRSLPLGLVATDANGGLLYFNSVAERILSPGDLEPAETNWGTNCGFFDIDGEQPLASEELPWERALRGETVRGHRVKFIDSDNSGNQAILSCHANPLSEGGTVTTLHDVTRDAELERRLLESNQELERFAHVASHDLKSPLRGVIGCLSMLEQELGQDLTGDSARLLRHAVDSGKRMNEMIEGLLAYSSLGSEPISLKEVDMRVLVESVIDDLEIEANLTNLPVIKAHEVLVSRLFHNLLSNAQKYRSPERDLEISVEYSAGVFSVRDNGIGIAAPDHKKIFGVYQRLHSQTEIPGSGLGLSECQKIVSRHGGRIWVESELNKGAKFCFTLQSPGLEQTES